MNIAKTVQGHVLEEAGKCDNEYRNAYTDHFVPVVKYAKRFAVEVEADEEVVEIAAWLHDIGSIHGHKDVHHEYGRDYAQKYLTELGYPQEKIDMVKHAIHAHRGSKSITRETKEAECVADADAASHIFGAVDLLKLAFVGFEMDTQKAKEFVRSKLERSYKKLSEHGREAVGEYYEAAMLLLGEV